MKYVVILSPDARRDILSAKAWYSTINPELASRFHLKVRETTRRVASFPYSYPFIDKPLRRAVVRRFPYIIYFEIKERFVRVVAVFHQRRGYPFRWH